MRVFLLAYGTRGDVQPMLALARALRTAGHDALVAAPESFAPLAAGHAIPFAGLDEGVLDLWAAPDIAQVAGERRGGLRSLRAYSTLVRRMRPALRRLFDGAWAAARGSGADLVVHAPVATAGPHIAERLGVPAVIAALDPLYLPTREFAHPLGLNPPWLPPALNRLTFHAFLRGQLRLAGIGVERWRREVLGLPRRRHRHDLLRLPDGRPAPVLNQVSRHVLPPPSDWPSTVHTTGYWFLPPAADWSPPPRLADFLAAGPPPVYIGFGSVVGPDPGGTGRLVLDAVAATGVRAVIATGWGGISASGGLPDGVLAIDEAPHDWLLPRTAVVVHHAGGTTWSAAAAGRPQVVCPAVGDQPFWAARLHALGVAPPPLPAGSLTAAALAAAIRAAPTLSRRAADLGEAVRAEDGAATAVTALEKILAGR